MTYNVQNFTADEYERYPGPTGEDICEKPDFRPNPLCGVVWRTHSERAEKVDFGHHNCQIVSYNVER